MAADARHPADPPVSPHARAQLDDARRHLEAARATADAGTDVPESARLRQVKRAVNLGLRPVTSHQVPFNNELALTVERLAEVVDELMATIDRGLPAGGALAGPEATGAVVTALASLEVGQAEADDAVAALEATAGELQRRLAAAEAELASLRQTVGAARAREEVVLRAAREAIAAAEAGAAVPLAPLAHAAEELDDELLARLAAAGRPDAATLRAHAAALIDTVADASAGAPVLDLASGRGEWLDAWAARGLPALGVDAAAEAVAGLRARGREVAHEDPIAHLARVADGALGAVTAAELADVRPLADVVAVVDDALRALRPGGVLVLVAARPESQSRGARLWADPRRRPVAPDLLVLLVLERGGAEVDVTDLDEDTYAVVARTPGGGSAG